MQMPTLIHVPRPGTAYSTAQGSAIATVIYEMAQAAQLDGVQTRVILKRGVAVDYPVGTPDFVAFGDSPRRWQRRVDERLARWGKKRFFAARFWQPLPGAIPADFSGPVFLHDNFEPLHSLKISRPKAKICLWLHNYNWRHLQPAELPQALAAAHRIVCVSDFVAQSLLRECSAYCPDLAEKVAVVLNGVNAERFKPSPNTKCPSSAPIISFAGRMVEKKGVHLLLEAAQILASNPTTSHFRLRFIGSKSIEPGEKLSPYERQLHDKAMALGERVEWVGFVTRDQMPALLAQSDIFCAPAIWNEPCGLTVSEGMASGCAVVTARVGGIPEVAADAVLYFERDNAQSLAQVLAKLLGDADLRCEYGRKARSRALQSTWAHSFESLRLQVL